MNLLFGMDLPEQQSRYSKLFLISLHLLDGLYKIDLHKRERKCVYDVLLLFVGLPMASLTMSWCIVFLLLVLIPEQSWLNVLLHLITLSFFRERGKAICVSDSRFGHFSMYRDSRDVRWIMLYGSDVNSGQSVKWSSFTEVSCCSHSSWSLLKASR